MGDFPLSGCFSEDGVLYWGTGEIFNELIYHDNFVEALDVERVFC